MKVRDFAANLGLRLLTGESGLDKEVSGMYICDLLSWVMSHADKQNAWVTVHTHLNIVAVALLTEVSCIIVPENIQVEEATISKAVEEGVPILGTDMNSYELSCRAYQMFSDTAGS